MSLGDSPGGYVSLLARLVPQVDAGAGQTLTHATGVRDIKEDKEGDGNSCHVHAGKWQSDSLS